MLRAAFWFTALIFVPLGLFLYFLPPGVASLVGVSPLWLVRASGGLVFVWGAFLLAASALPDGLKVGALVAGNLLSVATLLPAVIRQGEQMPAQVRMALLALCALLTLLAVVAMLSLPSRRSRL
ncbi:hypothetical protein GCM10008955_03840 [Deinococcus malanensis]|uniref:Uncharacterized protein n=1 Tax=Deinococcus malanensis TaxID=1706855 RepID=A0ABQ2EJ46_9DEIO|nr:hypothetical protein [Deinococcus malanensis]GGK13725.1 hypothetical protein GCM10008955_03840 [Deinococcus malanensis]